MEFNFILPENFKNQSIKQLLEEVWLVPRKQRHFLRMKKHVLLNGAVVDWATIPVKFDRISVRFDKEDFEAHPVKFGDATQADILYEDEHLVIVNKPEGMKTHGNDQDELALQNHVAAALGQAVFVVHRLDRETSGAVLFAKNQFVLPILGQMFEKNQIHREYLALVDGTFRQNDFTITQAIGRDRHDRRKRVVTPKGQTAITHVTVLEKLGKKSLVKCKLDTGRTHQIRVHLSNLTAPIVGDELYGRSDSRLMLHARQISLTQPFTGEKLVISAPSQSFDQRYNQEKRNENQSNR